MRAEASPPSPPSKATEAPGAVGLALAAETLEALPVAVLVVDAAGHITSANGRACRMLGYGPGELNGWPSELIVAPLDLQSDLAAHHVLCRRKDGTEVTLSIDAEPHGDTIICVMTEASATIARTRRLDQLTILGGALAAFAEACITETSVATLAQTCCRGLVERARVTMAWIGILASDGSMGRIASWGFEGSYLDEIDPGHEWMLLAPAGRRPRPSYLSSDLRVDATDEAWRSQLARSGFRSLLALSLWAHQRPVGMLCMYSTSPDAFPADALGELELGGRLVGLHLDLLMGRA
jgi:PAS domain S-box-containing protein